jgi:hypothetical protein
MKVWNLVLLYVVFCIVGTGLEWGYGAYWDWLGESPWVYGDSPLRYTCFEGMPLWGMGGLICVAIYSAFRSGWRKIFWVVPPVALAALWILVFALVIK